MYVLLIISARCLGNQREYYVRRKQIPAWSVNYPKPRRRKRADEVGGVVGWFDGSDAIRPSNHQTEQSRTAILDYETLPLYIHQALVVRLRGFDALNELAMEFGGIG